MSLKKAIYLFICALTFNSCCLWNSVCSNGNKANADQIKNDSLLFLNAVETLDTSKIGHFTIDVNLHYVRNKDFGTFYRGEPANQDLKNGLFWSGLFVNHVNWVLDSLGRSSTSGANFEGDAHYNIRLYSDPENPLDSFGGIWFWEKHPYAFPYKDRVLNIVFLDDGKRTLNGSACGMNFCSALTLYGAYHNVHFEGIFGWWAFAGLFNHELGHIMGLCHSFYCGNACAGIDLDLQKECVVRDCFNDCGGPNNGACNNWDSGSQNMMGYNANQNALTPCQWKSIMKNLFLTHAKYVHYQAPVPFNTRN